MFVPTRQVLLLVQEALYCRSPLAAASLPCVHVLSGKYLVGKGQVDLTQIAAPGQIEHRAKQQQQQ